MRRLPRILLFSSTVLLSLVVVAAFLIVGTETGRVWLGQTGLSVAAGQFAGGLQWQGLESPAINHWRLKKLKITGKETVQIEADRIDLRWRPQQLLQGRLVLESLRFKRLAISAPVEGGASTRRNNNGMEPGMLPVTVHSLSIDSLVLPMAGRDLPREWRLDGKLDLWSGNSRLTADIKLNPRDAAGNKLSLSLNAGYDGAARFSGWYSETPKGLVTAMLRLPRDEPFEASFNGLMDQRDGAVHLSIRDLAFSLRQHDVSIRGELRQDGTTVSTSGLRMDVDGSEQMLKGRVREGHLDLQLDLRDLPLDLASAWAGTALKGSAGGHIDVSGDIANPAAAGELEIRTMYRDQTLSVVLKARANRDHLRIEHAAIAAGKVVQATAGGTVEINEHTVDLDVLIENTDLDRIRALGITVPDTFKGKLQAHTTIKGPWKRPVVDLQGMFSGYYKDSVPLVLNIAASTSPQVHTQQTPGQQPDFDIAVRHLDLQVRKRQMTGAGHIEVSLQPLAMEFRGAHLDTAGSSHTLTGNIRGDRLALDLTLRAFPLDTLAPLLEQPITGTVSGKLLLGGTFSDPRLQGKFNSDLNWRKLPVHVGGELAATRSRLEIKGVDLSSGKATVTAVGVVDLTGDATRVHLKAGDVQSSLLRRINSRIPTQLDGLLQADLTLSGPIHLPRIAGTARFAGRYQEVPVNLSFKGAGDRDRFEVSELNMTTGDDGRLSLRGGYERKTGAHIKLDATALPAQLLRWDDWSLPPGHVDGSLKLTGTAQQPAASGRISYHRNTQQGENAAVLSAVDAQVALDQDNFNVYLTLAGENARTGKIRISLPWRRYLQRPDTETLAQTPLAGTIHGDAYLQEICALLLDTDIQDCHGGIKADLKLSNTFNAPRFDGTIVLENGSYENQESGTSLQDIQVDIKAAGNRLEIVKATASDGAKGSLDLEGKAHWGNTIHDLDTDLVLHVIDAHLLRRYDMDGTANGALTLTGGLKELFLSGSLEVQPFNLALEALLQEDIPTLKVTNDDTGMNRVQATQEKRGWLPPVNLNVELSANQQAFLRGQGLEAELRGKIQIQGVYPDATYRGSFKTVRGNVHILGKKFTLSGGEVRLDNEVFSLLIPAVYQGKDIEVHAQLSGTVDELHLDLSSTPVYPEDEIVSRLLFNKSSENISPLQAIRLANAITMLKSGGRPLFDPLSKIQKALSVDSLSVEDAENGNGVTLGVGKYISDKVYIDVETGTGAGEPWQGNIQIELLPNLNLENTINGETGFGNIELQWKKDY